MSSAQEQKTTYRLLSFLKRRPDLTVEQFQKHWLEVHAPLVKSVHSFQKYVLRYEQVLNEFILPSYSVWLVSLVLLTPGALALPTRRRR
jgi:EthD domain